MTTITQQSMMTGTSNSKFNQILKYSVETFSHK